MLPAWSDKLLALGQASFSQNGYLFSGELTGWRKPTLLRSLLNTAAKMVYRVPTELSGTASATLEFSFQPDEGDEFTLGEETYKFTATVTNAYDVLIGADVAASVANAYAAVTFDDNAGTNAGTLYGTGTVPNPAIDQTTPHTKNTAGPNSLKTVAPSFGAAFNTTAVATNTSGARIYWTYNNAMTNYFGGGVNKTFDPDIAGAATWLEFPDRFTDVLRSPVVDDRYDRYYFASPSLPPRYNTHDRISNGDPAWFLGVPPPGCTPGVEVSGGGDSGTVGTASGTQTAGQYAPSGNKMYLVPITPTGAAILNDITAIPAQTSALGSIMGVLYDDLNGSPHRLINYGVVATGMTANTPISSAFANPTGLLLNTKYWIGFMVDDNTEFLRANDTTSTVGVTSSATFSNGPPATVNSPAAGAPLLLAYGNTTTSAVLESRSYIYTYVTEYDEESPPSPAVTLLGWSNGTWTVSLFMPPVDQLGKVGDTRNIKTSRIYRTITAQTGATTYFLVDEVPVEQPTYVDVISDDILATKNQLSSQLWFPPPENLQGFSSMPNGIFVGFVGNEIWFSEPYRPHAWPPSYVLTTEHPIIGVGITGNSVVAATAGKPYVATGVNPGSMSLVKTDYVEPCTSRGSVLGNTDGVYYTSPNGLILVTASGQVSNITESWITREKWQRYTPQKNLRAVFLVSCYFAFGFKDDAGDASEAQRGFTIELNTADNQSFSIWPQPGGHRLGFQLLTSPNGYDIDALTTDPWTGQAMLVQNAQQYFYDFSNQEPVMVPYKWRSKVYQQRTLKNFTVMRISFTIPPGTPTPPVGRQVLPFDDPTWDTLGPTQYGIVRVYADGELVTVREIRTSSELLRIASGFKANNWQWEFEGRVSIQNVKLGTSVGELADI